MCVNRDDCKDCPFYISKCSFGEPKPGTWFDEETIEIQAAPDFEMVNEPEIVEQPAEQAAEHVAEQAVEEVAEQVAEQVTEQVAEQTNEPAEQTAEQPAAIPLQQNENDDSEGTWLVSTTMGSFFTKYVFICSKCGYKKESVFSMPPTSFCPECEKRKASQE